MQDARGITDYRSSRVIDLPGAPPGMNSYEQRQYMNRYGPELHNLSWSKSIAEKACLPRCKDQKPIVPPHSKLTCTPKKCTSTVVDPNGIGIEIDYGFPKQEPDEVDAVYQEVERALPENNCATASGDLWYYPIDGQVLSEYPRLARPGGGIPLHANTRTGLKR